MESQIEKMQCLQIIAYSDIMLEKTNPVYMIFEQRKIAAKRFFEEKVESEVYIQYIEQCNKIIKQQLGIW